MEKLYVSAKMIHRDMGIKWEFNAWFDSKVRSLDLKNKISGCENPDYDRRNIESTGGAKGTVIILTEAAAQKIVQSCRKKNYAIPRRLLREYSSFSQKTTIAQIAELFKMTIPALKKIYFSPENPHISPDRWYENRLIEVDVENIALAIKKAKS
jgi:hypothetical protein